MFFLRKRADPLLVYLKAERGNGVEFCMGPRFVKIDHDGPILTSQTEFPLPDSESGRF
jgi:hypothetical protein